MSLNFEIVQNLDFDVRAAIEAVSKTVEPVVVLAPMPKEESVYVFGVIREVKPGQVRAPGTRRVPQPYRFINGKRVANRSKRFSR